jgi:hypothetical protein
MLRKIFRPKNNEGNEISKVSLREPTLSYLLDKAYQ